MNPLLVAVMFLPGIVGWDYPRTVGWYLQITGLVLLCALTAYQNVLSNRVNRARWREERAEYRKHMQN